MTAADYRTLHIREKWAEAGEDALQAARDCIVKERWRTAVSRSYYTAYSLTASVLAKEGVDFPEDRVGPAHEPLPDLVRDHLKKLFAPDTLHEVRRIITYLYKSRLDAGYRPHLTVDKQAALRAEQQATAVRKLLSAELP